MPVLKDFRQTKKITLKSYPDSEIEIYNSVLAKDGGALWGLQENPNDIEKLIEILPKFIKSWNFQNEAKELLPVTGDSINLFSLDDLTFIVNEIKEFSESLKKD